MKYKTLLVIALAAITLSVSAQYGGKAYQKIISDNADKVDSDSRYRVALAYEALRQYEQAYSLFEQLYRSDSSHKSLLYDLSRVSRTIGQYPISIAWLEQAVAATVDDNYTLTLLAEAYLQGEQPDSAIRICRKILVTDSTNHQIHTLLGQAYQMRQRSDLALSSYRRAVSLSPRNLSNVIRYITTLNAVNYDKTQFKDAIDICDTALVYHPYNKALLKIFGQFQYHNKDYPPAHTTFKRVLRIKDSSLLVLKYAGMTAVHINCKLDSTLGFLMPAYRIDSTDMEILMSISIAYMKDKLYDKALLYIKKLESINVPNIEIMEKTEDLRGSITQGLGEPIDKIIPHYLNAYDYSQRFNANYLIKIYQLQPYSTNLSQEQRERSLYWMYKIAKDHIIKQKRNTRTLYSAIKVFKDAVEGAFMEGNDAVVIRSHNGERTIISCDELREMNKQLEQIREQSFSL